jgi:hypothetical protein
MPTTGIKLVFIIDRQDVSSEAETKFLVAFIVLRKAISFVLSVRPRGTARLHWTDMYKILYLSIFRKSVEKIKISLKLDTINGRRVSITNLMHKFFYSLTICMLHYNPRHVSRINMPIFRRTDCIITASGIGTLCKVQYSMPDESRLLCSLLSYCYRIKEFVH